MVHGRDVFELTGSLSTSRRAAAFRRRRVDLHRFLSSNPVSLKGKAPWEDESEEMCNVRHCRLLIRVLHSTIKSLTLGFLLSFCNPVQQPVGCSSVLVMARLPFDIVA